MISPRSSFNCLLRSSHPGDSSRSVCETSIINHYRSYFNLVVVMGTILVGSSNGSYFRLDIFYDGV